MKVTLSPRCEGVPSEYTCGTHTFASFSRIVMALERAGELRLAPHEYVEAVQIEPHGLSFIIGSKPN